MRIITLKASNVKRLKAVEISPEDDVVVVAGRNAQGKSSVLDAIWMALAGAAGAKETTRPIRDGEKQASVSLDLGEITVARVWTESGTTLVVSSADGARYPSPQTLLDGLIGKLTFDPLAFAESSAKDQLATLLSVVELPWDPAELARRRQTEYDQRTEINREIKRLEGVLSEIPRAPGDTPDEEISAGSLASLIESLVLDARQYDEAMAAVLSAEAKVEKLRTDLRAAETDLAERRNEVRAWEDETRTERLGTARLELAGVDETNAAVRAKHERMRISAELADAKASSDVLTDLLATIDQEKADAIAKAQMPLDGLSFDEDGVLYQGIPLAQTSASERLRVSIAIAMALNPKIRVIRITDGSLLDSENMALISEMAGEHDFQIWVERVDETGEVGITIENGEVSE
jgi:AAA domain